MKGNSHEKGVSYGPHRGMGLYTPEYSPICLLTGCLMTYAMESLIPVVGLLMCMFAMMGVISLAMYDEQGEWRRYRLALPVSRRSVVLARYGVALTLMLAGLALALGLDVILWLLGDGTGAFRIHDRNARRGYGHAYVWCNRGYREHLCNRVCRTHGFQMGISTSRDSHTARACAHGCSR